MARIIKNRFPAKCRRCGSQVAVGEQVTWESGEGIEHLRCEPHMEFESEDSDSHWNEKASIVRAAGSGSYYGGY